MSVALDKPTCVALTGLHRGENPQAGAPVVASLMKETLLRAGDDLTRGNVMKQATTLQNVRVPMVLPKLLINTTPAAYYPIKFLQLSQFSGQVWNPLIEFIRNARNQAEPVEEASVPVSPSR